MDKLHCSGIEASLLECRRFTPLGLTTCEHREVAGVRCNGKTLAKNAVVYGLLVLIASLFLQTSMNAALAMEVVNRSVPMLLVALPATVQ